MKIRGNPENPRKSESDDPGKSGKIQKILEKLENPCPGKSGKILVDPGKSEKIGKIRAGESNKIRQNLRKSGNNLDFGSGMGRVLL